MEINLEPIAVLTIYGKQSDEEDFATRHPEATVSFMPDWKRKELERFTFLQSDLAHSFMSAQATWKKKGGEIYVSDCLRPLDTQIELIVRKPSLAAIPGTSLHGPGMAIDYDTEKLGRDPESGRRYTFRDFNDHLLEYGWRVHPRAFRSSRHAEAWHIQPTHFRGAEFKSNMDVMKILMAEGGPEIMGREEWIINRIATLRREASLPFKTQVKKIQQMGKLSADGVIGPITRGYLSLFDIEYMKGPSTYKG